MQKIKRICIPSAKNKKKSFPLPQIKTIYIADAKKKIALPVSKLKKHWHCQCKKLKKFTLPMQKIKKLVLSMQKIKRICIPSTKD